MADFRGWGYPPIPEVFFALRCPLDGRNQAEERITTRETIQTGRVVENRRLCREHARLTFRVASLPTVQPGQFVHVRPLQTSRHDAAVNGREDGSRPDVCEGGGQSPMLRRAFSIAGVRPVAEGVEVSILYRVVGTATRRMESLAEDDCLSVLGPLGNSFPIHSSKPAAWMVAGGVGLPAMFLLAEALQQGGKSAIAFYGAQSRDLVALTLDPNTPLSKDARRPVPAAAEFAQTETPVIVSTDDGSLGFHGHVGAALEAYSRANPIDADSLVVYTCGPERMMRFVAEYCCARGIECYVCMERAMACGTGTCQSCVVPLRDGEDAEGWRYHLCCRDGPVFNARDVVWDQPGAS